MVNKVLIHVIDDDEKHCEMMVDVLTHFGFDCVRSLDGKSGIATTREKLPGLVFLDIQLPDLTGFEICQAIKKDKSCRDIPIIMASGKALKPSERQIGHRMGIRDFVTKPIEFSVLRDKIQIWLKGVPHG